MKGIRITIEELDGDKRNVLHQAFVLSDTYTQNRDILNLLFVANKKFNDRLEKSYEFSD